MMAEPDYEYRWVARFDDGEEWDSHLMESLEAAEAVASTRQSEENNYQATDEGPDPRLTFSVERRIVVIPQPWVAVGQKGA